MNGEIGMRALHAFYAGKILMESEVAALLADVDADDLDADDLDADDGAYPVSDSMVENLVAQFDNDVVREAANMGHHYRLFYAFEHFVRRVVYEQLLAIYDNDWWGHVPQTVQPECFGKSAARN